MTPSRQKRIARHARTARVRAAMHPGFTGVLFDVWRRARTIWMELCDKFETSPAALAACGRVQRHRHRQITDWLFNLESLVRQLILAAALTLRVTLGVLTRQPRSRRHSKRRVLVWPDRPETWRKLRFRIFPRTAKPCDRDYAKPATPRHFYDSLPLAHRLQALRLVLRNPQAAARRAAFRLARLAAADRTSNKPRGFVVRDDAPLTRAPTFGEMIVESAFEKLTPVLADRLDAWSRRTEPG